MTNTSTTHINKFNEEIDSVIAARKEQLPAIEEQKDRARAKFGKLHNLDLQLKDLLKVGIDGGLRAGVEDARKHLSGYMDHLKSHLESLDELEAEFKRDTLNIGVSGLARAGKSTTLQQITGLTNEQIPTGRLNPTTAVRSEIYNSSRSVAEIHFKSKGEFIGDYLNPHIANVNKFLPADKCIAISSLAEFKAVQLPEQLTEEGVTSEATDSLKRLKDALRSITTYEHLLGSEKKSVKLGDIKKYVTYPSHEDEIAETKGGTVCDRRYLAVKLAKVFCPFPNLGDVKVGLVDLPGLGEIGNSVSTIHLKGLESKVDQILLVMRPTDQEAFVGSEIGTNLDQLNDIQPAVLRRGDLIVVGVNKDASLPDDVSESMCDSFNCEINSGREDQYQLMTYDAMSNKSATSVFTYMLRRLSELLPEMDKAKIDTCICGFDIDAELAATADAVIECMNRVSASIPSPDSIVNNRINAIFRDVTRSLGDYAEGLKDASSSSSKAGLAFKDDVSRIHEAAKERIANGLFRPSEEEWETLTSGAADYYSLYRQECRRICFEIIDSYGQLDCFYGSEVSSFKMHILDGLLEACGMANRFRFSDAVDANGRIAAVREELNATLPNANFDKALDLLQRCRFEFRDNVYLNIEPLLTELENPSETLSKYGPNIRQELGGGGLSSAKQEKLRGYLVQVANSANDKVFEALNSQEDKFNKYLAAAAGFFNNALFGKDEDDFKQVFIRGLIREYKQYVLPGVEDASKSRIGELAKSAKEAASDLKDVVGEKRLGAEVKAGVSANDERKPKKSA